MAWTDAQLRAVLSPDGQDKQVQLERVIQTGSTVEVYVIGITAPYAGRSRWVRGLDPVNNSAATDGATILAALTADR